MSLASVLYLVTLAPGSGLLVPQTPVTVAALFGAVVTVVLVALLLLVAPTVASPGCTTSSSCFRRYPRSRSSPSGSTPASTPPPT
ncbi:MAG: hypothetical protein V5A25_09820 [Halovenus sp.]